MISCMHNQLSTLSPNADRFTRMERKNTTDNYLCIVHPYIHKHAYVRVCLFTCSVIIIRMHICASLASQNVKFRRVWRSWFWLTSFLCNMRQACKQADRQADKHLVKPATIIIIITTNNWIMRPTRAHVPTCHTLITIATYGW